MDLGYGPISECPISDIMENYTGDDISSDTNEPCVNPFCFGPSVFPLNNRGQSIL